MSEFIDYQKANIEFQEMIVDLATQLDVQISINAAISEAGKRLGAENQALREALEIYAITNETFPEYGDVAREVLNKYKTAEDAEG